MPRPRQDRKRAAAELEHGGGDVDVAVVGEPRGFAHGAVGVDLHDLLARDEAQRVEVVDVEVAEDAAGARDVRLGGRRWDRASRRARSSRRPSAPLDDRLPRGAVAGVESPLEADLDEDPAALDRRRSRPSRAASSSATGFSQNAGSPAPAASSEHRHVRRGGRRDHERVDARGDERRRGVAATSRPSSPARRRARAASASHTVTAATPGSDASVRT